MEEIGRSGTFAGERPPGKNTRSRMQEICSLARIYRQEATNQLVVGPRMLDKG